MKDIKGYEGLYAITSCGRVWSYGRQKFLKPKITKDNYLRIGLYKNNERKQYFIHRLVAQAYLPNEQNLPVVNHKDEIKSHNYINNLEWCTTQYNNIYNGRAKRIAKKCMKYKLIKCIENEKIYKNYDDISNDLNINRTNIMTHMTEAIEKGWAISGYHFEEVM